MAYCPKVDRWTNQNGVLKKGYDERSRCVLLPFSKIQLVVYYQCCVLIGWATTRLYVIARVAKSAGFDYSLKTLANVSSSVIVITVIMLKLIWNSTPQCIVIHYLNKLVTHSALMLYGPNLKGSRFESVAFSIPIRTHNFNSYLSQKLAENVVVIQWQLLHHSLFESNFLLK